MADKMQEAREQGQDLAEYNAGLVKMLFAKSTMHKIGKKQIVMLFGLIRSGKSTTISVLLRSEYVLDPATNELVLKWSAVPAPATSPGMESKTTFVTLHKGDGMSWYLANMAGVTENRGKEAKLFTRDATRVLCVQSQSIRALCLCINFSSGFPMDTTGESESFDTLALSFFTLLQVEEETGNILEEKAREETARRDRSGAEARARAQKSSVDEDPSVVREAVLELAERAAKSVVVVMKHPFFLGHVVTKEQVCGRAERYIRELSDMVDRRASEIKRTAKKNGAADQLHMRQMYAKLFLMRVIASAAQHGRVVLSQPYNAEACKEQRSSMLEMLDSMPTPLAPETQAAMAHSFSDSSLLFSRVLSHHVCALLPLVSSLAASAADLRRALVRNEHVLVSLQDDWEAVKQEQLIEVDSAVSTLRAEIQTTSDQVAALESSTAELLVDEQPFRREKQGGFWKWVRRGQSASATYTYSKGVPVKRYAVEGDDFEFERKDSGTKSTELELRLESHENCHLRAVVKVFVREKDHPDTIQRVSMLKKRIASKEKELVAQKQRKQQVSACTTAAQLRDVLVTELQTVQKEMRRLEGTLLEEDADCKMERMACREPEKERRVRVVEVCTGLYRVAKMYRRSDLLHESYATDTPGGQGIDEFIVAFQQYNELAEDTNVRRHLPEQHVVRASNDIVDDECVPPTPTIERNVRSALVAVGERCFPVLCSQWRTLKESADLEFGLALFGCACGMAWGWSLTACVIVATAFFFLGRYIRVTVRAYRRDLETSTAQYHAAVRVWTDNHVRKVLAMLEAGSKSTDELLRRTLSELVSKFDLRIDLRKLEFNGAKAVGVDM